MERLCLDNFIGRVRFQFPEYGFSIKDDHWNACLECGSLSQVEAGGQIRSPDLCSRVQQNFMMNLSLLIFHDSSVYLNCWYPCILKKVNE